MTFGIIGQWPFRSIQWPGKKLNWLLLPSKHFMKRGGLSNCICKGHPHTNTHTHRSDANGSDNARARLGNWTLSSFNGVAPL